MTTKAHTPTPWFVAMSDNATPHILTKDMGFTHHYDRDEVLAALVCYMPAEIMQSFNSVANAEHIVRCVNSHDDLVAALAEARSWIVRSGAPYKAGIIANIDAALSSAQP